MYLTNPREHKSDKQQSHNGPRINVGDVVMLKNDSTKRLFWKIAIVQELLTGNDGKVRAAIIKTTDEQNKPQLLRRSTQHFIWIKVGETEEMSPPPSADDSTTSTQEVTTTRRPRRQVAVVGELNRRVNKTY